MNDIQQIILWRAARNMFMYGVLSRNKCKKLFPQYIWTGITIKSLHQFFRYSNRSEVLEYGIWQFG